MTLNGGGGNKITGGSFYASGSTQGLTLAESYADIPHVSGEIEVTGEGYAKASYNISVYTDGTGYIVAYFTPYIYQIDGTGTFRPFDTNSNRWKVFRQYFEQYINVPARQTILVQAMISITEVYGDIKFGLRGRATGGTVKILRMNHSAEYERGTKPTVTLVVP